MTDSPPSPPRKPHEASWPTLSPDTDPAAEAIQTSRSIAMAGLKKRHPDAGPEELRRRFMDLWLGEERAETVYSPLDQALDR